LIQQRDADVLYDRVLGQQVVRLKDEPEVPTADPRQVRVVQVGYILGAQKVLPAGAAVEAPEEVQQGGLARPRRTHEGDEVALLDIQRDAGQRGDEDFVHLVLLDQIDNPDDGGHRQVLSG
jgi:hypothetical protein